MENYEPGWLLFASDSAVMALWGAGFLVAAVIALVMDRRRHKRDRLGAPDRVGWVPWTSVFMLCAVLGGGLLAASLH
jgi:multisubunit Na+/H+ antiporter MnhE subunit